MENKKIILRRTVFSLFSLLLLLSASGALAVPVRPGDVTTGPPEVLFDISIQPVFGQGNSIWFIIALAVVVIVVLGAIYFILRARKKKMLQKVSQINDPK